jgi:transglutaminase-like putative cysteine protease
MPTPITLAWLPPGTPGSLATLQHMKALVNQGLADPVVIERARLVVRGEPPRDYDAHVFAIRLYLKEHVQFVSDPLGQETLATPRYLLDMIARHYVVQGDCDDAAILAATLAKAIGLRARFVILGFNTPGAPFTHVFTIVQGRTRWWNLDTTRSDRIGPLPAVTRVFRMEV